MERVRRIVVRLMLVPALALLVWTWHDARLPVGDSSSYWVAGHALLERQNPYNTDYALRMERAEGFGLARPFVMRNPPWALWLTLPLGVLGHTAALLLWSCVLVVSLIISVRLLLRSSELNGIAIQPSVPARDFFVRGVLPAFFFAPTIVCLAVGQSGPLVLLGLTLFLCYLDGDAWWAGAALMLAAIKPQVALLFWVALLLWIIDRRRWRVLAGAFTAIAGAAMVAIAFDPHVLGDFMRMLRTEPIAQQSLPTLGGWLRSRFGYTWLQVAPAVAGVLGTFIYYVRTREDWRWREKMPVLLLASFVVTPYAFLYDEVILLAVFLPLAMRAGLRLTAAFVMVNVALFAAIASHTRVTSFSYVWTPWAWIALYALARMQTRTRSEVAKAGAEAR